MDPLSIQMVMGSPPMLRNKISFTNLIGRKKRSPDSDASASSKTPTRLPKIDEQPDPTPTRRNTVRKRRGYRPLSVLTNSVLLPFEFDALKAMEEFQETEKNVGKPTAESQGSRAEGATESSCQQQSESKTMTSLPLSNGSEVSLRAFLSQSSPPQVTTREVQEEVKGPFQSLYTIPAPDLSQHPCNSDDPFSSQSDSPLLITTNTSAEIRKFAAQARNSISVFSNRSSSGSEASSGRDKKKYTFFEKLNGPSTPQNRASSTGEETSPSPKHHPKSCPIEVNYPSPETPTQDAGKKRAPSGGIRKLSDIFKSRVQAEKLLQEESDLADDSPSAVVKRLEEYLRKVTCSPTYPYSDTSWLPPHPNSGRFWRSRNLKCTSCVEVSCACCRRTCCAYKAAVMALKTHKDNPQGREVAVERIQQITMVFPYGRELPTFLRCTASVGNGAGCGKLVCPECCGVCPDEACGDIQCRRCKKNPWAECDWHSNMTQRSSMGDAVSVRHTV